MNTIDNEIADKPADNKEKKEQTSNTGSFRIPRRAIDILIKNKATAWQIGAYLTIAKHTDESGNFSTCGYKAIHNYTGMTAGTEKQPKVGRKTVDELLPMGREWSEPKNPKKKDKSKLHGILYTPEEWLNKTGELIPEIPHELHKVRFVVNDFDGDDWIWFPNSLIEGYGRFKQPLKRLKQIGDIAARLLLLMYMNDNMEEFGGVPPFGNVYNKYELEHLKTGHDFSFWSASRKHEVVFKNMSLPLLSINDFTSEEEKEKLFTIFWNALSSLKNRGFIYECIAVMDGNPESENSRPIYDITVKTQHGQIPKGEEGLLKKLHEVFQLKGYDLADAAGRFYGIYPVLSYVGVQPYAAGIYRLRFRITNAKNYPVKATWINIQQNRNEWKQNIKQLKEVLESRYKANKNRKTDITDDEEIPF